MKKYIIIAIFFIWIGPAIAGDQFDYGIIRGDQVGLRIKPDLKSPIIRYLHVGEMVYSIERSEKREYVNKIYDNWYKIETQEGKSGWIFGIYLYIIDPAMEDGRSQKIILDKHFSVYRPELKKTITERGELRISFLYEMGNIGNNHWHLNFTTKYIFISGKDIPHVFKLGSNISDVGSWSYVYKLTGNVAELVLERINHKWYFLNQYLVAYYPGSKIATYDTNRTRKGREIIIPTGVPGIYLSEYEYTSNKYLSAGDFDERDENGDYLSTSRLSFNPESKVVTVHIKEIKTGTITKKEFKLENGDFLPMENEK